MLPAAIRRCGAGSAAFRMYGDAQNFQSTAAGARLSDTPGKQTVPRAELWAAILEAQNTPHGQELELHIDAAYVTNGMDKMSQLSKGHNGDLWHLLATTVSERQLRVRTVQAYAWRPLFEGSRA